MFKATLETREARRSIVRLRAKAGKSVKEQGRAVTRAMMVIEGQAKRITGPGGGIFKHGTGRLKQTLWTLHPSGSTMAHLASGVVYGYIQ